MSKNFEEIEKIIKEDVYKNPLPEMDTGIKATEEEKDFITYYMNGQNATASALKAFPNKKFPNNYAAIVGGRLVRKFGLKSKRRDKKLKESKDIVGYVVDKYKLGEITEEELYKEMKRLAFHSNSDQTRFNALARLKEWLAEATTEYEAAKLSMLDIVPLMTEALADLPRGKYIEVLLGVHKKRLSLNKERRARYDADLERKEERARLARLTARDREKKAELENGGVFNGN